MYGPLSSAFPDPPLIENSTDRNIIKQTIKFTHTQVNYIFINRKVSSPLPFTNFAKMIFIINCTDFPFDLIFVPSVDLHSPPSPNF